MTIPHRNRVEHHIERLLMDDLQNPSAVPDMWIQGVFHAHAATSLTNKGCLDFVGLDCMLRKN